MPRVSKYTQLFLGRGYVEAASVAILPVVSIDGYFPTWQDAVTSFRLSLIEIYKRDEQEKSAKTSTVSRMSVEVDGLEVSKRVLNEALFSHSCPAAMTRMVFEAKRYDCSGLRRARLLDIPQPCVGRV